MVVRDLEAIQSEKDARKARREKEGYQVEEDTDSDDDTKITKKGPSS